MNLEKLKEIFKEKLTVLKRTSVRFCKTTGGKIIVTLGIVMIAGVSIGYVVLNETPHVEEDKVADVVEKDDETKEDVKDEETDVNDDKVETENTEETTTEDTKQPETEQPTPQPEVEQPAVTPEPAPQPEVEQPVVTPAPAPQPEVETPTVTPPAPTPEPTPEPTPPVVEQEKQLYVIYRSSKGETHVPYSIIQAEAGGDVTIYSLMHNLGASVGEYWA